MPALLKQMAGISCKKQTECQKYAFGIGFVFGLITKTPMNIASARNNTGEASLHADRLAFADQLTSKRLPQVSKIHAIIFPF